MEKKGSTVYNLGLLICWNAKTGQRESEDRGEQKSWSRASIL